MQQEQLSIRPASQLNQLSYALRSLLALHAGLVHVFNPLSVSLSDSVPGFGALVRVCRSTFLGACSLSCCAVSLCCTSCWVAGTRQWEVKTVASPCCKAQNKQTYIKVTTPGVLTESGHGLLLLSLLLPRVFVTYTRRTSEQPSTVGTGNGSAEHLVWQGTTWQGCPDACFCCSPVCCSNCKRSPSTCMTNHPAAQHPFSEYSKMQISAREQYHALSPRLTVGPLLQGIGILPSNV